RENPEAVREREVVLVPVLIAHVTPVPAHVSRQSVAHLVVRGVGLAVLEYRLRTRGDVELTQREPCLLLESIALLLGFHDEPPCVCPLTTCWRTNQGGAERGGGRAQHGDGQAMPSARPCWREACARAPSPRPRPSDGMESEEREGLEKTTPDRASSAC